MVHIQFAFHYCLTEDAQPPNIYFYKSLLVCSTCLTIHLVLCFTINIDLITMEINYQYTDGQACDQTVGKSRKLYIKYWIYIDIYDGIYWSDISIIAYVAALSYLKRKSQSLCAYVTIYKHNFKKIIMYGAVIRICKGLRLACMGAKKIPDHIFQLLKFESKVDVIIVNLFTIQTIRYNCPLNTVMKTDQIIG